MLHHKDKLSVSLTFSCAASVSMVKLSHPSQQTAISAVKAELVLPQGTMGEHDVKH
jgi:hypothetical protein